MAGIKKFWDGRKVDIKNIVGGRKRDIKDIMYEAAEETAGIIKPIRLRSLYKERFKKDVDESEIMKMANKLIKDQERQGKPSIIKYEAEDGGTIYLHIGAFEEWLSKGTFLSNLQALFKEVAMKTGGRKQEVEKYKLEDLLVEHKIPRGLSTEIVLEALCRTGKLIKNDGTYSMPEASEMRKRTVIESFVRDALETKGFMPEDELVSFVMKKANDEFSSVERGSTLGELSVDEGDVEMIIEDMLGDRFVRLEHKAGDSKIDVIADEQNIRRILEDARPAVIEKLRGKLKEKIGSDEGLTEEDVLKTIEESLRSS